MEDLEHRLSRLQSIQTLEEMSPISSAEKALYDGKPEATLKILQNEVRSNPSDPKLRIFLFQLLIILGKWDRSLAQLDVAAELDPSALAMKQTYRELINCEILRKDVFDGRKVPLIFGQPENWMAFLVESLILNGQNNRDQSDILRNRAFYEAPACSGFINDQSFSWIADADMRLGPVCEAIINGRYYWVPYHQLCKLEIFEPEDLRDSVWMPVYFEFNNGGQSEGFIPTRYPGSEFNVDASIMMARKTEWIEFNPNVYHGLGQRVLATDIGDFALMNVREIRFNNSD